MPEQIHPDKQALIEALLAEPVLARLATTHAATLQPHVVPVWFSWDGENIWISSFLSTRKIKDLHSNPLCAVLVEPKAEGSKLQAVLLEGPAELVSEPVEQVRQIAQGIYTRYLGAEGAQAPEPQSWLNDPQHLVIRLTPRKVIAW